MTEEYSNRLELGAIVSYELYRPIPDTITFDDNSKTQKIIVDQALAIICGITEDKFGRFGYSIVFLDDGKLIYVEQKSIKFVAHAGDFLLNLVKNHFNKQ